MSKPEIDPNIEYPKMLYRKGIENTFEIWGYQMQKAVVQNAIEKDAALKNGWKENPNEVIAQCEREEKLLKLWKLYKSNWQWFWSIIVAIILAMYF